MVVAAARPRRRKVVRLHAAQAAFRQSDALYRGFVGGRGSGKTWAGAYDLIRRAKAGRTYLVGSPTSILMRDITYPTVEAIARDLGVWDPAGVRLSPYPTVRLSTGATIRFRSAEDPEHLRGPNLSGVWLDEASLMAEAAYLISIACLREGGEQGWLSATFTPKGLEHWTYRTFGGETPRPNTAIFHATTYANPFLASEFAATLEGQYSGLLAQQEIGGQFLTVEGAEWPPEYFPPSIWFDDWPAVDLVATALDPSKGKDSKSGDYYCYAALGLARDTSLWCEGWMGRLPKEQLVETGFEVYRQRPADAFVVEANAYQELLADDFARVARERGIVLPLMTLTNMVNKQVRIRRLGPYLKAGKIRFRNTPGTRLLVEQLRGFPEAQYDDGPDALEMSLRSLIELHNGRRKKR